MPPATTRHYWHYRDDFHIHTRLQAFSTRGCIPLSLSLDNLIAGTRLGLLGVSPVLAAAIFAAITVLMSFVGLRLGRAVGRLIPIRADLVSGIALVIMAVVLAL